jgi:hypothetical protein
MVFIKFLLNFMPKIATTAVAFGSATYVVITVELMAICYGLGVFHEIQVIASRRKNLTQPSNSDYEANDRHSGIGASSSTSIFEKNHLL